MQSLGDHGKTESTCKRRGGKWPKKYSAEYIHTFLKCSSTIVCKIYQLLLVDERLAISTTTLPLCIHFIVDQVLIVFIDLNAKPVIIVLLLFYTPITTLGRERSEDLHSYCFNQNRECFVVKSLHGI